MIPKVTWLEAQRRMDRRQGEHTTLIGPPGRGKTQAMIELSKQSIPVNAYSIFLATKRIDDTQDLLQGEGYAVAHKAKDIEADHPKWILRPPWPKKFSPDEVFAFHRREFGECLSRAFRETGWTINIDELPYIVRQLGLEKQLLILWLQGRSQGNTVICNTQRPRFVPLEAYEAATHLIFFQQHDRREIERIAEMASFDRDAVVREMTKIGHHDMLYANTVTREMFITNTNWK